jgi:hypothetical protein
MKLLVRGMNLLMIILVVSACAGADVWVVRSTPNGGTLGYRSENSKQESKDELNYKFAKAAEGLCGIGNWETVEDQMRSKEYTYTAYKTVTSTTTANAYANNGASAHGSERTTSSVPVQETGTTYWREATIACR